MASYHQPPLHSQQSDDTDNPNARLYDPYLGLDLPYQTLYNLPTQPQLLFPENSHARNLGQTLTYYTGSGYLAGTLAGAGKGFFDGVKAAEYGDTMKLRINRILNGSGQAGRSLGNRAGVIGLIYSVIEGSVFMFRAEDDVFNGVAAGIATGAFYRAASGPRSAVVAGAIGGLLAGAVAVARQSAKGYVQIDRSKTLL